jgi:hypothetical protein
MLEKALASAIRKLFISPKVKKIGGKKIEQH